jgi:hypothetical protein
MLREGLELYEVGQTKEMVLTRRPSKLSEEGWGPTVRRIVSMGLEFKYPLMAFYYIRLA